MTTKESYRKQCALLARIASKLKIESTDMNAFLEKQKWFMVINGLNRIQGKVTISKDGAIKKFGQDWCDKCWIEELFKTGSYEANEVTMTPEDAKSFYPYKLIK